MQPKALLHTMMAGVVLTMATGWGEFHLGGVNAKQAFDDPLTGEMVYQAVKGHDARVAALIDQGADVNAVGRDEATPLLWVLASGHLDTAELLLRKGADPNYRMRSGASLLAMAAGGDSVRRLRLLLDYGGNPNARAQFGRPITIHAVRQFRLDNLKLLIDRGADVNAHTPDGESSAATCAAAFNQFSMVEYLLGKGYRHDLDGLALACGTTVLDPDSQECRHRGQVLTLLRDKGVRFESLRYPPVKCLCLRKLRADGNLPAALIIASGEASAQRIRNKKRPAGDRQAREEISNFIAEKMKARALKTRPAAESPGE
jgi:hypothetical protein